MTASIDLQVRHVVAVVAAVAAAFAFTVWWATPARSAAAAPGSIGSFAVVARADNPVDALAASSVAGQLGAPVYLTPTHALDDQARQGLLDTDPDVVVLAGGPVALSPEVEQQVADLLPGAQLRRFAGEGRTETARLLNELPGELGIARPVLAGTTVAGDVGIDGALTVSGTDVTATLATVLDRLSALEDHVDTLEASNGALTTQVEELQSTLAGVTRTTVDGRDTLRFEAMNLHLVNGTGTTDGTPNGEGNLIIGYSSPRMSTTSADRAGSHYLVIGDNHHWTSHGGIVAGMFNTATGPSASVLGGAGNTASGQYSTVSGGSSNRASGAGGSVTGGELNSASGYHASVFGGADNIASGSHTSVVGGRFGSVSDSFDSRIGNTDYPDS